jgi:hypothetical protein
VATKCGCFGEDEPFLGTSHSPTRVTQTPHVA